MTNLVTQPDLMSTAAADLAEIRSAIGAASTTTAGPTTGLVAAAGDEISAAVAKLFSAYGQEARALIDQASAFHDEFTRVLAAGGFAYAETEIANAAAAAKGALSSITAPIQSLLGGGSGGAVVAAGVTGSATTSASPLVQALAAPGRTITILMGASGYPTPSQLYIDTLSGLFVKPWQTLGILQGLSTPEGLYPLTGVKDLTLDESAARGQTILDNAIHTAYSAGFKNINIFGYSQSATISSMEMNYLHNTPGALPTDLKLSFTLIGDPSNPNGGLLARFPGLTLSPLGITMGLATPDNLFPTRIYSIEYDGFADFPQYPINVVSDVNAFLGLIELHGMYPRLDPTAITNAIPLQTLGDTQTSYYIIDTGHFPLTDFIRDIPVVGNPVADLLEPDLKVIADMGYGSTTVGYSTSPANIQTPFGVLPHLPASQVLSALNTGTQQGISAFTHDVGTLLTTPPHLSLNNLTSIATNAYNQVSTGITGLTSALSSPQSFIAALEAANSRITDAVAGSVSAAYSTLLPTADIVTSLLTSVPSYDVNVFLGGVQQILGGDITGGLEYALGGPLAVDTGMLVLVGGFEFRVFEHAATQIYYDITGKMPPPPMAVGGPQL